MSSSHHYKALFTRLLQRKLSPQDTEAILGWLDSEELDPEAAKLILSQLEQPVDNNQVSPAIVSSLEARLPAIFQKSQKQPVRPIHFLRRTWVRYAAAIIIILAGSGLIVLLQKKPVSQEAFIQPLPATDINPGSQGAILTLEDGSTVVLDNRGNGLVATQGGSKVVLDNGQLLYNAENHAAAVTYNTVTTPRGRQFQIILPDGTKVWLNAASSLRYPTAFTGTERKVEITGEVYFEVAHVTAASKAVPFLVKVNDKTEIEVLGTHFNINSYNDETSINTTLLEGSVRVINGNGKAMLKPGQQAQVTALQANQVEAIKIVNEVDMEKVMAWKNGVFNFQDASLEEVMRQLERWYDIEVTYEKDIPKLEFVGKMGRDLTLSNVLRGLEVSKVKFRREGRKVIVLEN